MADRFWVGDNGTWDPSSTTHWSTTSGGANGASAPIASDNAIFDANSFSTTGRIVTVSGSVACLNLDASAVTNAPRINFTNSSVLLQIQGNINTGGLLSFGTENGSQVTFSTGPNSITSNGLHWTVSTINFLESAGTYTLQDDLYALGATINFYRGTFDANDFNVTAATVNMGVSDASAVLMGTGTWSTTTGFAIKSSVCTVTIETSTVHISSGTLSVDNNFTLYDVEVAGTATLTAPAGKTLTMNDFTLNPLIGVTISFTSANSDTIYKATTFTANGSVGNIITLAPVSGHAYTIEAATASVSYVSVSRSVAAGAGIPFIDAPGGVDGGNNINWVFLASIEPQYNAGREGFLRIAPQRGSAINAIIDATEMTAERFHILQDFNGRIVETYAHEYTDGETGALSGIINSSVGVADATFQVLFNILVTVSTLHNFTATVGYTDESNVSRVLTIPFAQLAGSLVTAITNVTGVGPYEGVVLTIRAKGGTAITFNTTGTFTTVTYNADCSLVQIA